jgi:hypothetical protein
MTLDALVSLVNEIKTRIQKYHDLLQRNETLTRYVLIDPLLRAMGWDTENPEHVQPETTTQAGRPDYTLILDGRKVAFVGAKALGKQEDLIQQVSYCVSEGVRYFIATDGSKWEIYDTNIQKPLQEKRIVEWDILSMDAGEVVRRALSMFRPAGIGLPATPPLFWPPQKSGTPLTYLSPKPGDKLRYTKLAFPDGREYEIKTWRDILTRSIEWLVSTGKLPVPPIKAGRGVTYLINKVPQHENGRKFRSAKKVGEYYVECNFNNQDIIVQTKKLLDLAGITQGEVLLR